MKFLLFSLFLSTFLFLVAYAKDSSSSESDEETNIDSINYNRQGQDQLGGYHT
jgi:hypothetical protein